MRNRISSGEQGNVLSECSTEKISKIGNSFFKRVKPGISFAQSDSIRKGLLSPFFVSQVFGILPILL